MSLYPSNTRYPEPDSTYNNILKTIYKDNRNAANGIKKSLNNKTDPILQANVIPTNPPPKKSYLETYIQKHKQQEENRGRKKILSKSLDLFKTSINDTGLEKKCSKKIFTLQRQEYSKNDETQKRKVFPKYLNKPTLVALKETGREFREQTIKTTIKVNNAFGQPSKEIVKQNDKKKMLPIEFKNIYQDLGSKNNFSSARLKTSNIFSLDNEPKTNNLTKKKINYPYVRDNITGVLQYDGPTKYSTESLTHKINQNPFNILKKVDKFSWQK